MRKHVLILMTSAVILAHDVTAASAQAPELQTPSGPQTAPVPQPPSTAAPAIQPPTAAAPNPQPSSAGGPVPQPSSATVPPPRPTPGISVGPMMGGEHSQCRGRRRGMNAGLGMRTIFALMDANGDGKLSLEEYQAGQERIFKAMDANKDGFVTLQEMQDFMCGPGNSFALPRK